MGIPSYFSNVVKQHKNVIKKLSGLPQIHNLYMDTNGLVYDAVRVLGPRHGLSNDEYESRLIQTVCEKINEYVALFRPSDKVLIAFDGVAPVAKLNQQRERRYKSWFTSVVEKMIARKNALLDPVGVAGACGEAWNTSAITPGTRFMTKLNEQMRDYCAEKARVIGSSVVYIYSGSDAPGEGEHKIFEYIRDNAGYHRDTTTLIYGLDADLIMLCLNHLHVSENIYLYRDTPDFIQSLDSTLSCNEQYYLDIPEFACSLEKVMRETTRGGAGAGVGAGAYVSDAITVAADAKAAVAAAAAAAKAKAHITPDVIAAIDDYIVMTFMLGNDFMPHFPSLNLRTNGMTVLLQTYANMFQQSKESLVTRATADGRPTIVWKSMRAFIALLAETEHNRFMNEHKTRDRQGKQRFGGGAEGVKLGGLGQKSGGASTTTATTTGGAPVAVVAAAVDIRELTKIACDRVTRWVGNMERCHSMTEFMSIPLQERAVERYIDPFRENWEFRYYDALFGVDIYAKERERQRERGGGSSGDSVDRLQMICVNYIEGIEWTMRYYSTGCVDWRWTYKYPYAPLLVDLMRYIPHLDTALFPAVATPVKNPVRDLVQLCYVLPMASHSLLPTPVAEKMKRYYSHYYCDKLDFKWSYCKYFWEAHTELPHIQIAELERAVAAETATSRQLPAGI